MLQGKEIGDNDSFQFNSGFTAQLFRVKINTIQMKETTEENKKTNDQVMQDRQYQVPYHISSSNFSGGFAGLECGT